jgi:hypothetical protein
MLERDLEMRFRRKVTAAGGITEKIAPVRAGVPDRLVLWPGGRIELVELKTETGQLSPIQAVWHQRAAERGVIVVVLHGPAEVDAYVERNQTMTATPAAVPRSGGGGLDARSPDDHASLGSTDHLSHRGVSQVGSPSGPDSTPGPDGDGWLE